jgi:hypothetical protein
VHGVEGPESPYEFPTTGGLILITEVGVAERAEQKQDGVQVGIPIKKGLQVAAIRALLFAWATILSRLACF